MSEKNHCLDFTLLVVFVQTFRSSYYIKVSTIFMCIDYIEVMGSSDR